jgi:multidrug efflux pump subunit AcrB
LAFETFDAFSLGGRLALRHYGRFDLPAFNYVGWRFCRTKTNRHSASTCAVRRERASPPRNLFSNESRRDVREQLPGLQNTLVQVGGWGGGATNTGNVNVSLVPVDERKFSQADLINKTRGIVKKYQSKDYRVNVLRLVFHRQQSRIGARRFGPSVISSPDRTFKARRNTRISWSKNFARTILSATPTARSKLGSPEIRVLIDRAKAADLGVQAGDVAQALNILSAVSASRRSAKIRPIRRFDSS